jgi:hypothetical protein
LQKNSNISVKDFVQAEERHLLFNIPLSDEAFDQFCDLEITLQAIELNENKDRWKYIWGNENFSSAKAYKQLIGSQNVHPAFRWLWRSSCQHKHEVLFWLLLQDGLNTRSLLRTKNMHIESYDCELCLLQKEEKIRHLFLRCSFAKNC